MEALDGLFGNTDLYVMIVTRLDHDRVRASFKVHLKRSSGVIKAVVEQVRVLERETYSALPVLSARWNSDAHNAKQQRTGSCRKGHTCKPIFRCTDRGE